MSSSRTNGRTVALLAALLFGGTSICGAQSHPQESQSEASQKTRSLAQVESFFRNYKDQILSEAEVMKWLSQSQFDFKATKETLDKLRDDGANDAMIEEVKKRAKREEITTSLTVKCAPAECRIKINGRPAGVTSEGRLDQSGLKPAEYTIDFEKDGYTGEQKIFKLSAEPGQSVSVTLVPTLATRLANGKKLYDAMVRALGGPAALKSLTSVTASGAATSYKDGKQSDWEFDVEMAPPQLMEMKVTGSAGGFLFGCKGERCAEKKKGFLFIKSGKKLPAAVVSELESNLRLFSHYNLISVMEILNSKGIRTMAHTADLSGKTDQHMRAEGDDHVYEVTLGTNGRPTSVEDNPRSELGAVKVTYGDYVKVGEYFYPKRTTIRGAAQSGIEVRLEHVDLGSKLKLSDFPK